MFKKQEIDTLKEKNLNKLLAYARHGLLQKPVYVEYLVNNKFITLEEINEAQELYDRTKATEETTFFKRIASFFDGFNTTSNASFNEFAIPKTLFEPGINKISVQAFDFDGCLFNRNYYRNKTKTRLLDANKELILNTSKAILTEKFDEVIFMVGSNRQSLEIDQVNDRDGASSCFPALLEICSKFQENLPMIPCRVDPYLLADTYGKQLSGENYKNALKKDKQYNYSHWLFDDSKITIIYAQIHKTASTYPNQEIVYNFYDDRCGGNDDIITALGHFFGEHADLVPHNIKIKFYHYAGNGIKHVSTIKGMGEIDKHFHEHVNLLIHAAGFSFHRDYDKSTHVLSKLHSENLAYFKRQRLVKIQDEDNKETYYSSEFGSVTNCALM